MRYTDLFTHKFIITRETGSFKHLSELINSKDFEVITPILLNSSFKLGNHSRSSESLLNNEICKFACAALESFVEITSNKISQKSLSWALIRTYYASFFAAHACLKAVGFFVSRLDRKSCDIIQQEALIYYPGNVKPLATDYLVKYYQDLNELEFIQLNSIHGGSYHERFWPVYNDFIDIGLNSPLATQLTYQDDILFIRSIKDAMNFKGVPYWLSTKRNEINYKLPCELWFPYENSKKAIYYENLIKSNCKKRNNLLDYNDFNSADELVRFNIICTSIIDFMIQVVDEYFNKSEIRGNLKKATYNRILKIYLQNKYAT